MKFNRSLFTTSSGNGGIDRFWKLKNMIFSTEWTMNNLQENRERERERENEKEREKPETVINALCSSFAHAIHIQCSNINIQNTPMQTRNMYTVYCIHMDTKLMKNFDIHHRSPLMIIIKYRSEFFGKKFTSINKIEMGQMKIENWKLKEKSDDWIDVPVKCDARKLLNTESSSN